MLGVLNYVAVAVPAIVGALAMAFGLSKAIVVIASLLLTVQLAVSIWALVAKWDDKFIYSAESASANYRIADRFVALAQPPFGDDLRKQYELLAQENSAREDQDHRQGLAEAELRYGMRAALRQFQRACAGCKQVPNDIVPSDCAVCGNF